jgi:hypothetical protein
MSLERFTETQRLGLSHSQYQIDSDKFDRSRDQASVHVDAVDIAVFIPLSASWGCAIRVSLCVGNRASMSCRDDRLFECVRFLSKRTVARMRLSVPRGMHEISSSIRC